MHVIAGTAANILLDTIILDYEWGNLLGIRLRVKTPELYRMFSEASALVVYDTGTRYATNF